MSAIVHDRYDDAYLRKILRDTRTIAMVGASANWNRPSYFAMKYLLDRGYKVIPVNPAAAGQEMGGKGMAQRMRGRAFRQAKRAAQPRHRELDDAGRERGAFGADE